MGNTFSKVRLKDGSIRFVKDTAARQDIANIQEDLNDLIVYIDTLPIGITVLPTPSESELGYIYQYLGETTEDFSTGVLYKCIYDAESEEYGWEALTYDAEEIDQKIQDIYDNIPSDEEIQDLFVTE